MKHTGIRVIAILVFLHAANVYLWAQSKMRISVIPMGTTHVFWKSVEAGAKNAGKALGAEIVWKGPVKENDRGQQISIVEQFINEGISGIVLAPLDHAALTRPVSSARAKHIPVVIFDSPLDGEAGKDFVSFVGTNNKHGGTVGGTHLSKLLGGRGKAVLLRFAVGAASSMAREEGFLEAIANQKGIEVIVKNRFAGATAGEAKTASMNLLDKLKDADGIFCPNESTTFGMLLALRQSNLAGKKKFVGFDTSPPLVEALRNGEIDALVAQDPTLIGFEAVKAIVSHINGEKVKGRIDTGVQLITRENLNDPKIKKLLGIP